MQTISEVTLRFIIPSAIHLPFMRIYKRGVQVQQLGNLIQEIVYI